jgi:hypothetical protein
MPSDRVYSFRRYNIQRVDTHLWMLTSIHAFISCSTEMSTSDIQSCISNVVPLIAYITAYGLKIKINLNTGVPTKHEEHVFVMYAVPQKASRIITKVRNKVS